MINVVTKLFEEFNKLRSGIKSFRDVLILASLLFTVGTFGISLYITYWVTSKVAPEEMLALLRESRVQRIIGITSGSFAEQYLFSVEEEIGSDNIAIITYNYANRTQVLNWTTQEGLFSDVVPIDRYPDQVAAHWNDQCFVHEDFSLKKRADVEMKSPPYVKGFSHAIFGDSSDGDHPTAFVITLFRENEEFPQNICNTLNNLSHSLRRLY